MRRDGVELLRRMRRRHVSVAGKHHDDGPIGDQHDGRGVDHHNQRRVYHDERSPGVDDHNVDGGHHGLLLPKDPDRSAVRLHRALKKIMKLSIPVIITDSFGRPWREGLTEVAIGVAGMKPLHDYRHRRDPYGYPLRVTLDAVADELACAAGLVCGKLARTPACIIRGFPYQGGSGRARDLIRPAANDLFR